jgi:pimeloyl-ACP methyl ester carboxylesterase
MIEINNHRLAVVETKAIPNNNKVAIFCHGFRSSSIGPNRFFVRAAAKLAELGIDSIRFDQYASGNSDGDFIESSFDDWIKTTVALSNQYLKRGYQVALFGQSMGGSTVIAAGAQLKELASIVAWAPDPSIDEYEDDGADFHEEGGERVGKRFWLEAHAANIAGALRVTESPAYIVQCGKDDYVSAKNHRAITSNAQKNHVVEMFPDLPHSAWTFDQATTIIEKSVSFINKHFKEHTKEIMPPFTRHLEKTAEIVRKLQARDISPVVYGSTGVSYYLGNFKSSFGDIDLLIDDVWLSKKWPQLQQIMSDMDYRLVDEHEHEFSHSSLPDVAFAGTSILVRDGIMNTLDELVTVTVDSVALRTLSPQAFRKAYDFSAKDGYRLEQRGKNDDKIIALLKEYLER